MSSETIFGINSVTTRLRRGNGLHKLMLRDGELSHRLKTVEQLARDRGCPIERVAEADLDRMTSVAHQGVALAVEAGSFVPEQSLDAIVLNASGDLLLMVLDGITDPRNLGACLRSAATLGVDAVIVPKDNSAPLTPAALKTASGGASMVPVVQVVNLSRCLDRLRKANVWVVGTLLDADQRLQDCDLTGNIAIILGAEDKGLRKNTVKHCDFLARIPMFNADLGFNVSVAAGIALYEARRQRDHRSKNSGEGP